jgi:hypothetical protein
VGEQQTGHRGAASCRHGKSLPNKIVRRLAPGTPLLPSHPAAGKGLVGGKPALYVCRNMTCEAPITDPAQVVIL